MDSDDKHFADSKLLNKNIVTNIDLNNEWKKHPISSFESKLMSDESIKQFRGSVKSFYKNQNELINELIKVDKYDEKVLENDVDIINGTVIQIDHCHLTKKNSVSKKMDIDETLAKSVFVINLILMIAKAAAAGMTGSLSIISSLLDSIFDLVSGLIMWLAANRMKQFNPYLYPQGRQRLEPISVIVLSVIMAVVSIQLLRESVTTIINMATAQQKAPNVNDISIGIIGVTIGLKIILWIVCRRFGKSEGSAALAQDSRNDVFTNSIVIVCAALSSRLGFDYLKYLDPCGGILIAIYILVGWIKTGYENVKTLTGITASSEFLQKMTFIAVNHHPDIKFVDTVRAFHFGTNFLVEIDIVLDELMPLKYAHDIGESLQKRIECLAEVERCFVHLDYEYIHDPKHEHKLVYER